MDMGSLTEIAKREGGITKQGKVSLAWAKKKIKSPRIHASTKKKLQFFINTVKKPVKKPIKKITKKKINPVSKSKYARIEDAKKLYKRFRGQNPEEIIELNIPSVKVASEIGTLDGVLYTTFRDGKTESYIHEFREKSKPILAVSCDGRQLIILGGKYKFTDRGIVDK